MEVAVVEVVASAAVVVVATADTIALVSDHNGDAGIVVLVVEVGWRWWRLQEEPWDGSAYQQPVAAVDAVDSQPQIG